MANCKSHIHRGIIVVFIIRLRDCAPSGSSDALSLVFPQDPTHDSGEFHGHVLIDIRVILVNRWWSLDASNGGRKFHSSFFHWGIIFVFLVVQRGARFLRLINNTTDGTCDIHGHIFVCVAFLGGLTVKYATYHTSNIHRHVFIWVELLGWLRLDYTTNCTCHIHIHVHVHVHFHAHICLCRILYVWFRLSLLRAGGKW